MVEIIETIMLCVSVVGNAWAICSVLDRIATALERRGGEDGETKPLTMRQTGLRQGGLMRCCIKTLQDIPVDTEVAYGEIRKCGWCPSKIILREDNRWELFPREDGANA